VVLAREEKSTEATGVVGAVADTGVEGE